MGQVGVLNGTVDDHQRDNHGSPRTRADGRHRGKSSPGRRPLDLAITARADPAAAFAPSPWSGESTTNAQELSAAAWHGPVSRH